MAVDTGLYCLDVGQGSCTVLIDRIPEGSGDNQAVIIDVGGNGEQLATWLKLNRVTRLMAVVLTHHDRDHVLGLGNLVLAFKRRINMLWLLPDRRDAPCSTQG